MKCYIDKKKENKCHENYSFNSSNVRQFETFLTHLLCGHNENLNDLSLVKHILNNTLNLPYLDQSLNTNWFVNNSF